jgi:hypothetical protein
MNYIGLDVHKTTVSVAEAYEMLDFCAAGNIVSDIEMIPHFIK